MKHIPHFSQKVMYFNSPVRIKPVFNHCPQEEFIKYARFIRRKAYTTEPGTNLHAMYVTYIFGVVLGIVNGSCVENKKNPANIGACLSFLQVQALPGFA